MKGCAERWWVLLGFLIVPLALVVASLDGETPANAKAPLYSEVLDELITHPLRVSPRSAR